MSDDLCSGKLRLFDPGPATSLEIQTRTLDRPLWSEYKADLIAKYLRYFLFITKHGTYIDAFAGPQTDKSDSVWTAEKVLAIEPAWLRRFRLCDISPSQVARLSQLKDRYSDRDIIVLQGDANEALPDALPAGSIAENEATFCLLDQRTFECSWSLCQYLAGLRPGSRKIEQFYFLANSWMERAFAGTTTREGEVRIQRWLGEADWRPVAALSRMDRAQHFVDKFRDELGYQSVKAWPIYERERGAGSVMYYMIHATDHDEAPKLMYRAYVQALNPPEPIEQLSIIVDDISLP